MTATQQEYYRALAEELRTIRKPVRITVRREDGGEQSLDGTYQPLTKTIATGAIEVPSSELDFWLRKIYSVELVDVEVAR